MCVCVISEIVFIFVVVVVVVVGGGGGGVGVGVLVCGCNLKWTAFIRTVDHSSCDESHKLQESNQEQLTYIMYRFRPLT